MTKRLIWKDDLDSVEEITLPTGKVVYRVVIIDSTTVLQVNEYEDIPLQYLREIKLDKLLNDRD